MFIDSCPKEMKSDVLILLQSSSSISEIAEAVKLLSSVFSRVDIGPNAVKVTIVFAFFFVRTCPGHSLILNNILVCNGMLLAKLHLYVISR